MASVDENEFVEVQQHAAEMRQSMVLGKDAEPFAIRRRRLRDRRPAEQARVHLPRWIGTFALHPLGKMPRLTSP